MILGLGLLLELSESVAPTLYEAQDCFSELMLYYPTVKPYNPRLDPKVLGNLLNFKLISFLMPGEFYRVKGKLA
jgi:hypothetical protein